MIKLLVSTSLIISSILFSQLSAMAELRWQTGRDGYVPDGAVSGGVDIDGETLYLCRARRTPGKLSRNDRAYLISYGGREIGYPRYEVLVANSYRWVLLTGDIPMGAVVGGKDDNGEPLYVCIASYHGIWVSGK